jgi:hypothetical protein
LLRIALREGAHAIQPGDASNFRILSRRAVDALAGLRERPQFMKGQRTAWSSRTWTTGMSAA